MFETLEAQENKTRRWGGFFGGFEKHLNKMKTNTVDIIFILTVLLYFISVWKSKIIAKNLSENINLLYFETGQKI